MPEFDHRFRELDDLVLHLKGLVLVRRYRERRGADAGELAVYAGEIDRVRDRLANLVQTAFGASPEEALAEVKKAKEAWLAAARKAEKPVPEPAIYVQ